MNGLNHFRSLLARIGPAADGREDSGFLQHRLVREGERVQGVLDDELEVEVVDREVGEDGHPFVKKLEAVIVEEQTPEKENKNGH